jgi:hypothetical protein
MFILSRASIAAENRYSLVLGWASVPEQVEVAVLAEAERILHRPPGRFVAAVPLGW